MYQGALVALKPGSANTSAATMAMTLAKKFHLHLTAIAIADTDTLSPAEPVPLGASAFKAERDQAMLARGRAAAEVALKDFDERCQSSNLKCTYLLREGERCAEIQRYAQQVDVVIVGHRASQDDQMIAATGSPIHQIASHCPRPIIISPCEVTDVGRILIAYDGSLQAARALQAFVDSGFHRGSEVHLLSVIESEAAATVSEPAIEYLRLHQIEAVVHQRPRQLSIAEDLLDAARHLNADMLVMGAYGRPSWLEMFLGSVTRTILERANLPVFLAH